jgi:hypothetical protein
MSEFEYLGVCPECNEASSFWGASSKAMCEKCKRWIKTRDMGRKIITKMV